MYVLCEYTRNLQSGAISTNKVEIIKRSDKLEEISDELKDRVLNGTPLRFLRIYEELVFDMRMDISISAPGVAKEET